MKKAICFFVLLSIATTAHAENGILPMASKPEEVGLSSTQLKRLEEVTQKHIDEGLVPGAVMLVARRGKIAWMSVLGKRDVAAGDAMKYDSIFRIYSMTKPIVSVALMQLVEEGKLQVSDPVSKYLPEIGKMKVGVEKTVDGKQVLQLSDPDRPMTVQDLLRHTSGLVYGSRGTTLVNQAYIDAKIGERTVTVEEMVHRLSTVPLKFSPGARWEYGVSVDVQGRLIEVIDGKTLGEAVSARVLKPLGMVDTGFQVPADKVARAAQPGPRPNGEPMTPRFAVNDGARYELGGGGMVSTMEDYLRFTAMLANKGELSGKRLLGKQTIAFMTDRPCRQPAGPAAGPGLRPGLRGPHRSGRGGAARLGRRIWLGRQCRHAVLDRSEGAAHRHLHGAGERSRPRRTAQPVQNDGAISHHRLRGETLMSHLSRRFAIALLSCAAVMPAALHAETPAPMAGKPEDVGLSSAQLKRLEAATKKNIDDGLMPGAVMLVARHGKVAWISVQGKRAPDSDDPMKFDSIFRIYSMTKPITSIALMQLVEEGKLQVSDPVAKYLPEIGKMKVGTEVAGARRQAGAPPQRSRPADDGAGPAAPHLRDSPTATAARRWSTRPISTPRSATAPPPSRRWCIACPACRCSSRRVRAGNTASRSTCRAA